MTTTKVLKHDKRGWLVLVTLDDKPYLVDRYSIIGTKCFGTAVYEPGEVMGTHGTLRSFTEVPEATKLSHCWGQVRSRHLTPELDRLKAYSNERHDKVMAYHGELKELENKLSRLAEQTVGASSC